MGLDQQKDGNEMKLLTKEMRKEMPSLYSQEEVKDPLCIAKIFHPWSSYRLFIIEGEPVLDDKGKEIDFHFFGYVTGLGFPELGYSSLNEISGIKLMGLPCERDLHWIPTPLSKVKAEFGGS